MSLCASYQVTLGGGFSGSAAWAASRTACCPSGIACRFAVAGSWCAFLWWLESLHTSVPLQAPCVPLRDLTVPSTGLWCLFSSRVSFLRMKGISCGGDDGSAPWLVAFYFILWSKVLT